jgi:hypothetical protein
MFIEFIDERRHASTKNQGCWAEKHREIDKEMAHGQHRFIQEKKPAQKVSRKRARDHSCLQTGGFIGKEGPGKGWGEFVHCLLLGVVKELSLVFWHRCRETRCFH